MDVLFGNLLRRKFFGKGWGDIYKLRRCLENQPIIINNCKDQAFVKQVLVEVNSKNEGCFVSPYEFLFPGLLEDSNKLVKFTIKEPKKYKEPFKPLIIHFCPTGDQKGFIPSIVAKSLLAHGIASLIYIYPFYGDRKPKNQKRSQLNYLIDLFVLGGAAILEAQCIVDWAQKQGFNPIAFHGLSLGGHISNLATCVHPKPISNIPCLSWTSGSVPYTKGALKSSINWNLLREQYQQYEEFMTQLHCHLQCSSDHNGSLNLFSDTNKLELAENKKSSSFFSKEKLKIDDNTLEFFSLLMGEFTDLDRYPVPVDPRLTTFVVSKYDTYFPLNHMQHISEIWTPSCSVRFIENYGHIRSIFHSITNGSAIQKAILETLNRYIGLYEMQEGPFKILQK